MTFMVPSRIQNLALALAVTFVIAGASTAAAQDADVDGVADRLDACPGTVALELVNPTGCSVCPCDGAWPTHQAYVNCVTAEVAKRTTMTRATKTAVLQHANQSTCGSPTLTRCCTWRYRAAYGTMGSCSLLAPAQCQSSLLKKWAENRGAGSCYYNPCTW